VIVTDTAVERGTPAKPSVWAPYRESATLAIASMTTAVLSFISGAPATLAQVFTGDATTINGPVRAQAAAMAVMAALGLGLGLGAIRTQRPDTRAWVRPLAAAAVIVAAVAIIVAVLTFWAAIAKDSPLPYFSDLGTGGD
jgi:hypothetical protein